ncbi:MAG: hypothetical protein VX951_09105 [Planctomycetota bacterium]|nr:hypothetical protein [Planctomycetota bacterium]
MTNRPPRALRWTILLCSTALFFLFCWLLGFVLGDIGDIPGPTRSDLSSSTATRKSEELQTSLKEQVSTLDRDLTYQQTIKQGRRDTMTEARATWDQMMAEYRFVVASGQTPGSELTTALDQVRTRYVTAQKTFDTANSEVAKLDAQLHKLRTELATVGRAVRDTRIKNNEEYFAARRAHRLIAGTWKLAFIVPIFLLAALARARKSRSIYRPILTAFALAGFLQLAVVMFDHFPEEFMKYVAIGTAILVLLVTTVRMLRSAASPRPELQHKQRSEAYQKDHCPVCSHNIPAQRGETFVCPACGTGLFEPCGSCQASRHSLLPYCTHCGATSVTT